MANLKKASKRTDTKVIRDLCKQEELEQAILRGVTSHYELSKLTGIPRGSMFVWLKRVQERWAETNAPQLDDKRNKRIHQVENLIRNSFVEFEKSKRPLTEITETEVVCGLCRGSTLSRKIEKIVCRVCFGDRIEEDLPNRYIPCKTCNAKGEELIFHPCESCEGKGIVILKRKLTKVQTGNPAYLNVIRQSIELAAKLEGIVIVSNSVGGKKTEIISQTIDGVTRTQVQELFYSAPAETLIEYMAMVDRMEQGLKSGVIKPKEIEATVNKEGGEE